MAAMAAERNAGAPDAVLLDALGTLLALEPPGPRLRAALARRGVTVGEEEAAIAMRAEIAYYREFLHEGRDDRALASLRRRCAEIVATTLGVPVGVEVLLEAIEFAPFGDVAPALHALRSRGARLVVVSNWDVSLHEALAQTGLDALVDAAVSSAEAGAAKPDPAIFAHALALAGVPADRAWHVGDSIEADVEGARAAGLRPVLIAREGSPPAPGGVRVVRSLVELAA